MMSNLMSFMENGVPVRFPKLRDLLHRGRADLGAVPADAARQGVRENRRQWPYYEDRPSEYIKQMWFATQPVEEPGQPARPGRPDPDLRRRGHDGLRLRLAAPRLRPPAARSSTCRSRPSTKRKLMGENALRLLPRIEVPARYGHRRRPGATARPSETVVCRLDELPPGQRQLVRVGALEVGVFNVEGELLRAAEPLHRTSSARSARARSRGTVVARAETGFRRGLGAGRPDPDLPLARARVRPDDRPLPGLPAGQAAQLPGRGAGRRGGPALLARRALSP